MSNSAQAHLEAGLHLLENGAPELARARLEQALILDPHLEDAYAALATACMDLRELEDAEGCASTGIERFPNNTACYEVRADARVARFDLAGAEADAGQALKLEERSVPALLAKATVFLLRQQPHEAIALLKKAREIDPENSDVLLTLGNAYVVEKNYTLGRDILVAAGEQDPLNWLVYLGLANLELLRGDPATGLSYTNLVLALAEHVPPVFALRGQFFLRLKRGAEAEEALRKAIEGNPRDAISLVCLAELEVERPATRPAAHAHARQAMEAVKRDDIARRAQAVLQRA